MGTAIAQYEGLQVHIFAQSADFAQRLAESVNKLGLIPVGHIHIKEIDKFLKDERPPVVICEESFIREGWDDYGELIANATDTHFILVSAEPDVLSCIEFMSIGASAYLSFPVQEAELSGLLADCLEKERSPAKLPVLKQQLENFKFEGIVGQSSAMREALNHIRKVASLDLPVLIHGENGTGKELAARSVHFNSNRHKKPFIPVHIGTLPEQLVAAELFGSVPGAYTEATNRIGKIEAAEHGTLFLDEVGEIPMEIQVKLLRALETKEVTRLGDTKTKKIDFRLVAATNRDLAQMVKDGTFREDLYFRIKGLVVTMPALRERKSDIPELVQLFVKHFNERYPERTITRIPPETFEAFKQKNWPGNIRELKQQVEVACALSEGGVLQYGERALSLTMDHESEGIDSLLDQDMTFDDMHKLIIEKALERNKGNRKQTAKQLNIPERTFYRMLDRFDLKNKKF